MGEIIENIKPFSRAMCRCRSIPCPAGTAQAEDPLRKVKYISKAVLRRSFHQVHQIKRR